MAKTTKKSPAKKTTVTKKPSTTKKATAKPAAKKPTTAKKTPAKKAAAVRQKPELVQAKLSAIKTKSVIASKGTRRPPSTPSIPEGVAINILNELANINAQLDQYAACQKAFGFLARSLRYTQTPHFKSWSFAEGKTPKLSGVAG